MIKKWLPILSLVLLMIPACRRATPSAIGNMPPSPSPVPTLPASPTISPTATVPPTPTPNSYPGGEQAAPEIGPRADQLLYERLLNSEPPIYDRVMLAVALRGVDAANIPQPPATPLRAYRVGDAEVFWAHDLTAETYLQIEARLMHISQHAYFWLDTANMGAGADWAAVGERFDRTYEAVRAVFGSEDSPGVDGDPRLHILNSSRLGQVGGYFSATNTLPAVVDPYSNAREMFFVSIQGTGGIGSAYYNQTLAHEFQHMIHHNLDLNEDGWLDEGLAELAQQIAGMRADDWVSSYTLSPDQSLWYWGNEGSDYGQAYLFVDYLYERFGADFITALVADPANGLTSIERTLSRLGYDQSIESLFGDFIAALYFNDPTIGDGRYAFHLTRPGRVPTVETLTQTTSISGKVNQFGFDAISVVGRGLVTINFHGAESVALVPTYPYSGNFIWWSNRGDSSFSTLTRAVDLSAVDHAILTYATWYNLESDWDYAYVMVSTDGGQTWEIQRSSSSSQTNPNGTNYGHGLTGSSGSQDHADWVKERVDLSAYAGQTILLRFAVINDEAVHEAGMLIDDIAIPQIGFFDDAESGENGWLAEGFVHMHNRVPQRWLVLAALVGESTSIVPVNVVNGRGSLSVNLDTVREVVLLVSGQTQRTAVEAPYQIEVVR